MYFYLFIFLQHLAEWLPKNTKLANEASQACLESGVINIYLDTAINCVIKSSVE